MMLDGLTLHQLVCFEAVVSEGSFQAAAEKLSRSQPTLRQSAASGRASCSSACSTAADTASS